MQSEEEIVNIYRDVAGKFPTPQDAWVHNSNGFVRVTVTSNQKDLMQEKSRTFVTSYTKQQESFQLAGFPSELTSTHIYSPSPSGNFVAIIKIKDDPTATINTEYFIEIWDSFRLVSSVSTKGTVGYIYNDEWFGGLQWSPDESFLVFAAQPFVKQGVSFFSSDNSQPKGHQYDFVEDWGESYINKSTSALFLFNLKDESLKQLHGTPEDIASAGQVTWRNDSKTIAFVGWSIAATERRLGIKYCYQRRSSVFTLNVTESDAKAVLITPDDYVARSPRFTPDGNKVVYLASRKVITHNLCNQLRLYDLSTKSSETIVDTIDTPKKEGDFPGLYVGNLVTRCFLDNDHVLLDSVWYSYKVLLIVSLKDKSVNKVHEKDEYAWTVNDIQGRNVIVTASSPNTPPSIYYATYENGKFSEFSEIQSVHKAVSSSLKNITWKVHTVGTFPNIFQYISLSPSTNAPTPLVVYAHGGPHSSFVNDFQHTVAFLVVLGYSVILINYRGSLGFGKQVLESLLGKIGTQDVQDCIDCLDDYLKLGTVQTEKIVYIGGSHGGFLGGHLVAKDKRIKAAVLRNPVMNISGMVGVTDIPDWCEAEVGSSNLLDMLAASPLANIKSISAPVLFLIGDQDRRVPPSQAYQMYYALKENGVATAIKVYPKNGHAISKPEAEADGWINAALWYKKYLV